MACTPATQAEVIVEPIASEADKVEAKRQRLYADLEAGHRTDWDAMSSATQYLIDHAETVSHLREVCKHLALGAWYTDQIDLPQLWRKWLEKATQAGEVEEMWTFRKWLTSEQKEAATRKWFALATTYDQIANIPDIYDDAMLQQLITAKKQHLFQKALESAATCSELIDLWLKAEYNLKPTTLSNYAGWEKDDDLKLQKVYNFHKEASRSSSLQAEVNAKWLKVSLRDTKSSNSVDEMINAFGATHPEVMQELTEKWDSLSEAEVAKATTEEEITAAFRRCRDESAPQLIALQRMEKINIEQAEKAATTDECLRVFDKSYLRDGPAAKLALTKYANLATTEDEIRTAWHWTEKHPEVQILLAEKLSALIK